jgi:hypothetical protein
MLGTQQAVTGSVFDRLYVSKEEMQRQELMAANLFTFQDVEVHRYEPEGFNQGSILSWVDPALLSNANEIERKHIREKLDNRLERAKAKQDKPREQFGDPTKKGALRDRFVEPPFTVLDARKGEWNSRKRTYKNMGLRSEKGRDDNLINYGEFVRQIMINDNGTSVFDPVLAELMVKWFSDPGDHILDPFSGGSVRGIISAMCGRDYTGIDIRQEQIDENYGQLKKLIPDCPNQPRWLLGDSDNVLNDPNLGMYDGILSCPPYHDLEQYSDMEGDLSNMSYEEFSGKYFSIIQKACAHLKPGKFAVWVVGEVRDKKTGYLRDFVGLSKKCFLASGLRLWNDAVLLTPIGSASVRTNGFAASRKLVRIHQNVLVFFKPSDEIKNPKDLGRRDMVE